MQVNQLQSTEKSRSVNALSYDSSHVLSNHFDDRMSELLTIAETLILDKGVFHLVLHFSSSQLACSTFDKPFDFKLYSADEVFADDFMSNFSARKSKLHGMVDCNHVRPILDTLQWLRIKKHGSELVNASLHMVNGFVGLSFTCDDTRYIPFRDLISYL